MIATSKDLTMDTQMSKYNNFLIAEDFHSKTTETATRKYLF